MENLASFLPVLTGVAVGILGTKLGESAYTYVQNFFKYSVNDRLTSLEKRVCETEDKLRQGVLTLSGNSYKTVETAYGKQDINDLGFISSAVVNPTSSS